MQLVELAQACEVVAQGVALIVDLLGEQVEAAGDLAGAPVGVRHRTQLHRAELVAQLAETQVQVGHLEVEPLELRFDAERQLAQPAHLLVEVVRLALEQVGALLDPGVARPEQRQQVELAGLQRRQLFLPPGERGLVELEMVLAHVDLGLTPLDRRGTPASGSQCSFGVIEPSVAQVEAGLDEVDARFEAVDARFEAVDARFEAVDARFEAVDAGFEAVDAGFEAVDAGFEAVDAGLEEVQAPHGVSQRAKPAQLAASGWALLCHGLLMVPGRRP